MAEIRAFKALRFSENAGEIGELVCPPYDIISDDERKQFIKRNENNIIRLELPREGEDFYATAGETLETWINSGVLVNDDADGLYIYEIEFLNNGEKMSFKGLICRVRLEEFSKKIIVPHEETLSKAKTDRFNLMEATGCNFSQVYSLFADENGAADAKLDRNSSRPPDVEFCDDEGLIHRLWVVTDMVEIESLCADFADKKLFIADGHHRYETALNYKNAHPETENAKYIMMMLVSMDNDGLLVLPTHRIVHSLPDFDMDKLLTKSEQYFKII